MRSRAGGTDIGLARLRAVVALGDDLQRANEVRLSLGQGFRSAALWTTHEAFPSAGPRTRIALTTGGDRDLGVS
jgi:hypothetical protein